MPILATVLKQHPGNQGGKVPSLLTNIEEELLADNRRSTQSNNGTSRSKNRKSSKGISLKESRASNGKPEARLLQPGDPEVKVMFQQLRDQLDETGR